MRRTRLVQSLAAFSALALVATGCDTGDGDDTEQTTGTETEGTEGTTGGELSTYIGEPESLTTTNTTESEGIAVLRALYTPLITYDLETSEPAQGVAESIESEDEGLTWTITLQDGWTFHNGEPVTADSFINAWSYAADPANAQQNAGFFSMIEGYQEAPAPEETETETEAPTETESPTEGETGAATGTETETEAGTGTETETETETATGTETETEAAAEAETATETETETEAEAPEETEPVVPAGPAGTSEPLSGLEKIDDLTFRVTLTQPESFFNTRLGYPAYAPLPEAFFDDPEAFNESPIGNGPFMMDGEWQHDQHIRTVRFEDYPLEQAKVDALEFRIYADVNTAINDLLAGDLDIVDLVPPERFSEVQQQLGEENTGQTASSSINYLGMPWYDEQLGGEENQQLRQALSQAIDREAITEAIFDGLRQPAHNLLAPVIPGYEEEVCENWSYDPEAAQQAFEEAGGFDGTMTVWFNSGAAHDQWIEAVTNQWREVLGIEDFAFEQLQFADYLERLDNQEVTGPFRLGWGMDYPHPQNYLQLLLDSRFHSDAGGANSSFYENPEYDAAVDEALQEAELDAAIPEWQEAVEIACQDVPVIPMFYGENTFAHGEDVENLTVDAFGDINYTGVSLNE